MKIYTRTGDEGKTGLFSGPRVWKSNARIVAYGTVDELNAAVGMTRCHLTDPSLVDMDNILRDLQKRLFVLGADLATPINTRTEISRIGPADTSAIEEHIDRLEEALPELKQFILPAGVIAAASAHGARTVCRRAERKVVELGAIEDISQECVIFLNRTSDLLFVAARWINRQSDRPDEPWESGS